MSRHQGFFLCAFPALSTLALATNGETRPPGDTSAPEPANERGVPALFSLGDFDGDGRLDLAAVGGDGTLQLLANAGEGRFEDVTQRLGLADVANAALALWADYDGDGRLDLFVGAREGASRLFHNEGRAFTDMSTGSGLVPQGAVQSAQWLDFDGDGRFDLLVVTAQENELFRGLEGGFFERAELPLARPEKVRGPGVSIVLTSEEGERASDSPPAPGSTGAKGDTRTRRSSGGDMSEEGVNTSGAHVAQGSNPSPGGAPSFSLLASCLPAIRDQTNPSSCLQASTTPTLGRLYPISADLFVAVGGNVGIGTTSPGAKLEVAGTARITGTLTLNPAGDQALDVSTGSIYKGGALFLHTKGGSGNTGLGRDALSSLPGGFANTALGDQALRSNTNGSGNTASGFQALRDNTTGINNTASGHLALLLNMSGSNNTAVGQSALVFNTTGSRNTASGYQALAYNAANANTASGYQALRANTTGFGNTAVPVHGPSGMSAGVGWPRSDATETCSR